MTKVLLWPKLFEGWVCSDIHFSDMDSGYGDGIIGEGGDGNSDLYETQSNQRYINGANAYGDDTGGGDGIGITVE